MPTPGALFADLWQKVARPEAPWISLPWAGRHAPECDRLVDRLLAAASEEVPDEIGAYLEGRDVPFDCSVIAPDERAFVVMCALDAVAEHIHPAIKTRLAGLAKPPSPLLTQMKVQRREEGCYADVPGVGLVVPKGRLMPGPRPNDAGEASGNGLANQFRYLTLVRPLTDGRRLRILAPPPSRFSVPADRADHVGLAPIAEDRDDLAFATRSRGARPYLDTTPADTVLVDRISEVVTSLLDQGAGLVVLPELVSSPASLAALRAKLRARAGAGTQALILAGTGLSEDLCPTTNRPYNEAQLLTDDGRVLWSQKKLHRFNMGQERMTQCGIDFAPGFANQNHMEDVASGSDLTICDLFGLGRVMVLICEDLEQAIPGGPAAIDLRPDWILTPVLDIGQAVGRWTDRRAMELGRLSRSRVVVSCSSTLIVRKEGETRLADLKEGPANTGFCLDGQEDLRVNLVQSSGASSPEQTIVRWDSVKWPEHWLELRK